MLIVKGNNNVLCIQDLTAVANEDVRASIPPNVETSASTSTDMGSGTQGEALVGDGDVASEPAQVDEFLMTDGNGGVAAVQSDVIVRSSPGENLVSWDIYFPSIAGLHDMGQNELFGR